MLTDQRWQKLLQVMKSTGRIYNKPEHRMTFEGILYRLRTGIPWLDLPTEFGGWSAIYRRFNLCSKKGLLNMLFNELAKPADYDWVFADGSIVKAHQHSTGAATSDNECIGKSRGGNSTKIHLAVLSIGTLMAPPICGLMEPLKTVIFALKQGDYFSLFPPRPV